jgi:Phage replication protein CRI
MDLLLRGYDNYFTLSISLWKFYKGNNLVSFEMFEMKDAMKQLSALLDVRVEKGLLQRVDIAQNFEMDRPVGLYIKEIQKPRGMEVLYDFNNKSIGFCNTSRNQQIVFYDKIVKAKKQGISIFEFPQNLLRYEFRYKRQLRHFINWAGTKAKIKGAHQIFLFLE